ncbi:MAG: hypothetical protein IKA51_00905 [Clostridia bacterium]|nr:hypothetical protein [Clostridia bacterium]
MLNADKSFSFDDVVSIFEGLTDEENRLSISESVRFYRFNFSKFLRLRIVLYGTDDFNKKDFNNAKDRINKKANKEFEISQWGSRYDDSKMRYNVIYSKCLTADLYSFLSQNAEHNLRRVEGIINFAVVGNKIILPPLFGDCYDGQIFRYKEVIKFINQVFLNCKS